MSESLEAAVKELQDKLQTTLDEAASLKKAINKLCDVMGKQPLYLDEEAESAVGSFGLGRPDIYYGKQLATAVREYLDYVKQAAHPETIVRAMEHGGFDFEGLGWTEKNRLRNLSISLSKNTTAFRRLPNGMFGLETWYEKVARRKTKKRSAHKDVSEEENMGGS